MVPGRDGVARQEPPGRRPKFLRGNLPRRHVVRRELLAGAEPLQVLGEPDLPENFLDLAGVDLVVEFREGLAAFLVAEADIPAL